MGQGKHADGGASLARRQRSAPPYRLAVWLLAPALLGLVLRAASATGGLWLDEAWSMSMAHDVGTPLGVLLLINHDNNHHLNSLWLQLVGIDAPPVLQRALSIASGTAAVWVAGLIGARRDLLTGVLTAFAVAVAPVMVTFGSEARGYAPMTLALLSLIWLTDRALAGEAVQPRHLAIACAFGMLSQLTMVVGICAVSGWAAITLWRRSGVRGAAAWLHLFAPAWIATVCVVAVVLGGAYGFGSGFQFGNYVPFNALQWLLGIVEMIGYTVGWPLRSFWLALVTVGLVVLARGMGASRLPLLWLGIVAFPLCLALIQAGNVGHPRYYLTVGILLLLLGSEVVAEGIARGGWRRWLAGVTLVIFAAGSMVCNVELIRNQRGHPELIVAELARRAPEGSRLSMDREMEAPVFEVAAAQAAYPLTLVATPCPAERFLILERFRGEPFPTQAARCGIRYRAVAGRTATGMSGMHWTLYERAR